MVDGFTFWKNMKDTIETFPDEHMRYRLYDAITEYGLYGEMPEEDGDPQTTIIRGIVQSMLPSLDNSRNIRQKAQESGSRGGRVEKISAEEIERAVVKAALDRNKIPMVKDVRTAILELFDLEISDRTISRKVPEGRRKEIAESALETKQGQKGSVLTSDESAHGQNRDKIVPIDRDKTGTNETKQGQTGQNRDKTSVPSLSYNGFNF